jgi:uncharacterized protein YbjT (DUF2867 family)
MCPYRNRIKSVRYQQTSASKSLPLRPFRFLQYSRSRSRYIGPMITITTPTGQIGSQVLRALLAKGGTPLRVLVRDARKLPQEVQNSVEAVEGDIHDPKVLDRAMEGARALFWCQPDCPDSPDYVGAYQRLATTASDSIRACAVSRVVAISAAGSPGERPAGPISALHRMEAELVQSGAACRFLRCGSFFENLLWQWEGIQKSGVFCYCIPGDRPGPQVATNDIAAVAARLLSDPQWTGNAAIPLVGPKDLTFDEMATELASALERPVRYQAMVPNSYRDLLVSMGQSNDAAQGLVDMFTYLADGYQTSADTDRSLTPTTLAEWLRQATADTAGSRGTGLPAADR